MTPRSYSRWFAAALAHALVLSSCASTRPNPAAPGSADAPGVPAKPPAFVSIDPMSGPGADGKKDGKKDGKEHGKKSAGMAALEEELARAMKSLGALNPRAYFLGYEVHDRDTAIIVARNGAILAADDGKSRVMDIDLRVGDYDLDSTHPMRARGFEMPSFRGTVSLPLTDDPWAMRAIAWRETDRRYKAAAERFVQIKSRKQVDVEQEDKSGDFTREKAVTFHEAPATMSVDRGAWEKRLRALSGRFREVSEILESTIVLQAGTHNRWLVSSEGTRIQTGQAGHRLSISAQTRADDGMDLALHRSFDARELARLPGDKEIIAAIDEMITELKALRKAPLAEPFSGPAILEGKAAGVFFHEIFGHRAEGHRQKSDDEGQTFAKKIGEPVMPKFISVYDDPTLARLGAQDLNGFYRFDDEGVAAQRASLVDGGIMRGFLLARMPTRGFTRSNGHGRRQAGRPVVSRQANLVVQPSVAVPNEELKERLRAEARRQGKAYGIMFREITGGYTTTGRSGPQAFKVMPLVVYRVYADGRPDQLIRGADIVGTPLTSLSKILAASDDYQVFNGQCGAESGWVPVSAISPSLLIEQIEIERKEKGPDKPPVLAPPPLAHAKGGAQ